MNWGLFYEKSLSIPKKTERGDPLGFFNIHFVGKYQKMKGGPFGEKKSHRAENTLREYPLAPLNFLDDVKILLRKLSKNCTKLRNCKKSGPFRVDRQLKKNYPL